jgi:ApaG protein
MPDNPFNETTRNVKVSVKPTYLALESYPYREHYTWAYSVTLENNGNETVQLISRHWHITDGNGVLKEVLGPGVVGEQPILTPGSSFSYTSGTLLPTATGIMFGTYEMITDEGEIFQIKIPAFSLDSPEQLAKPN